ncbi:MAG: metallophosphoesterase family protein [Akkermansia sp.]
MSKIAIISDIHANLEALQAVLVDIKTMDCDQIACLGDIVGYNANPAECLDTIRNLNCPVVKGNHDEEAAGTSNPVGMNPAAYSALMWTREALSDEQKDWLRHLRMVRNVAPFTIVHSTLDQPGLWHYIINKFDATSNFNFQFTNLCFHGHTHVPKIFVYENMGVQEYQATDFTPESGKKYFINVGSVGQPRDNDWRASYCIYDTQQQVISFRRVEYDIKTTQQKILNAGLPIMLAERLAQGL